jgi:hypothetical protein
MHIIAHCKGWWHISAQGAPSTPCTFFFFFFFLSFLFVLSNLGFPEEERETSFTSFFFLFLLHNCQATPATVRHYDQGGPIRICCKVTDSLCGCDCVQNPKPGRLQVCVSCMGGGRLSIPFSLIFPIYHVLCSLRVNCKFFVGVW